MPNATERRARFAGPSFRSVLAAFVITLVVGLVVGRFAFLRAGDDAGIPIRPAAAGARDLDAATAALSADPQNPALMTRLGLAYLAEARRTADPTYYARADATIAKARSVDPSDVTAIVASGLLALARHDFAGALELATQAERLVPLAVDPLGVQVDALVELGRYDEAAMVVGEMVRRRPDVASLSRASYVAEIRGDREGALEVMQQAVAASGDRGAGAAYVAALLGDVQLSRGNLAAADAAYDRASTLQALQPQAELGRARVLVARNDLSGATEVLAALTDRIPLPDAVALHGDVLRASSDAEGAAKQYALVRAIEDLNQRTGGVSVDLELARFEVGQVGRPGGDATRAVALARLARAARPTVFADDILGWGLRRSGQSAEALPLLQSATRLGTGDATMWWHLAAAEHDLGRTADARQHLARSRQLGGPLPLLERSEAAALAAQLGL